MIPSNPRRPHPPLRGPAPRPTRRRASRWVAAAWLAAAGTSGAGHTVAGAPVDPPLAADAFDQIGGATTAVAVAPTDSGPTAFVGVGVRVVTYDLRDPRAPRRAGQTGVLPEVPEAIAVEGGRLYVGTRAAGGHDDGDRSGAGPAAGSDGAARLSLFDVRAPGRPAPTGSVTLDTAEVGAIAVVRAFAFVLVDRGLAVVDVKDPRRPAVVATTTFPVAPAPGTPWHPGALLATDDGDRLLAAHPAGLFVVDARDPLQPRTMGLDAGTAPAFGLARAGDVAYATRGPGGIDVVDLARPEGPAIVATLDAGTGADALAESPTAIAAAGTVAALVDGDGRWVVALDVRDPRRPRRAGRTRLAAFPSTHAGIGVAGGRAVVALGDAGLYTVGIAAEGAPSPPSGPAEPILPPLAHVSAAPPHVYAAAGPAGLYVVDTASAPRRVVGAWRGEVGLPDGSVRPVAIRGVQHAAGHVYALTEADGLWVFDVRDPAAPAPIGDPVPLPRVDAVGPLAVREGHLFVGAGDGSLRVFDIRDPARPAAVAVRRGFGITNLAIVGRFVYATAVGAFNIGHLHVFNATEPDNPRYLRTHDFDVFFNRLNGADGHLYLSGGYGDLAVLSLANPAAPVEVARLKHMVVGRTDLANGRLIAAQPSRVEALDVRDPTRPRRLGALALPWGRDDRVGTSDITVAGGDVLLLRHEAGLFSFDEARLPRSARVDRYLPLALSGGAATGGDPDRRGAAGPRSAEACAEPAPPPAHVTFVVDTSGDMRRPFGAGGPAAQTRLEAAQSALRAFAAAARGRPIAVGLVRLDRQAERTPATRDPLRLERAIRAVGAPRPPSAGDAAWRLELALAAVARDHRGHPAPRAGVASTGAPTDGTDPLADAEGRDPVRRHAILVLADDVGGETARAARDRAARLQSAGIDLRAVVVGAAGAGLPGAARHPVSAIVGDAGHVSHAADPDALAAVLVQWAHEIGGCGG